MEMAVNFGLPSRTLNLFEETGYGDAHIKAMRTIYDENPAQLELELAAMLDQQSLVQANYDLEDDRLEVLVTYDKIESLRTYGRALGEDGTLRNADSVLRKRFVIKVGTRIKKLWPGIGMCDARVIEVMKHPESTSSHVHREVHWQISYKLHVF